MKGLRLAIGFLTRIPLRGGTDDGSGDGDVGTAGMADAAVWFPVVGLAIGVLQGSVFLGAGRVLPPLPAAVLAVAAAALITGAFHHDGLADMADAFGGGWTVEERLTILKDSRLGTYGTAALVLAFATEISALSALSPGPGFRAVAAAHALSRAVAVVVMLLAPAAGDGLGAAYASYLDVPRVALATVFGVAAAALLLADVVTLLVAVALAGLAAIVVVALALRKIGGITGDVLGAVQVLSALTILLTAAGAAPSP